MLCSRSHDEEALRETMKREVETNPQVHLSTPTSSKTPEVEEEPLSNHTNSNGKEGRNSREHRHSWHSMFHPRRSLSLTSQDSSLGHEDAKDAKVPLSQVDELHFLSSATLLKGKRRSRT